MEKKMETITYYGIFWYILPVKAYGLGFISIINMYTYKRPKLR